MTYTTFEGTIQVPDIDSRKYEIITLSNSLRAIIVSDENADKAACAVDVGIGSLSDPADLEGLAHFCEHLLFLGTEKYPDENAYSSFLSKHGGNSNAFTAGDHTNYYFDVAADYLEKALDIFASFFTCPLFLDSCTDRELNAVDSEHMKNLQADSWRAYQITKDICDSNHPYSRFSTGNKFTLAERPASLGINTRQELIEFHKKYYSANIMTVSLLGKEPISLLRDWVVEKFSSIKNSNVVIPKFDPFPLPSANLKKLLKIKSVKDLRKLSILFPCNDHRKNYRTKPLQYSAHLIGHEGPGSLLSNLKSKGLALNLNAGLSGLGAAGIEFFKIDIELSPLGMENIDPILVSLFQYIRMIRKMGVVDWVYDECRAISDINFRFRENGSASSTCSGLAANLQDFEFEHAVSGRYVMDKFDKDLIEKCFDYLKLENVLVRLQSSHFTDIENWMTSTYYDAKYCLEPLSPDLLKSLDELEENLELYVPERNPFIPTNFELHGTKKEKGAVGPALILNNELIKLWHKLDDTFMVPKAYCYVEIKSLKGYESVESCLKTKLIVEILKEEVNELSYFAAVAGLHLRLENTTEGLVLNIYGYNDKLCVLLEKILSIMEKMPEDEARFERLRDKAKKRMVSWFADPPHRHAVYYFSQLTQEKLFTNESKLKAIDTITLPSVVKFFDEFFNECQLEILVNGNISADEAIKISKIIKDALNPECGLKHEVGMRTHMMPKGGNLIYSRISHNLKESNSAIEFCIQVGNVADPTLRVNTSLIAHIANEPAFNILRTQEQLGYIVSSGVRKQTGMISFRIIIQSHKHPLFLEARIEKFLNTLRGIIEALDDVEFNKYKKSMADKLLEKMRNLENESSFFWSHITSRYYEFNQNETDSRMVSKNSKVSLLEFYDNYIAASAPNRCKASVHIASAKLASTPAADLMEARNDITFIESEDLLDLQSQLELTSYPTPVTTE